jgi:hypothetical protein
MIEKGEFSAFLRDPPCRRTAARRQRLCGRIAAGAWEVDWDRIRVGSDVVTQLDGFVAVPRDRSGVAGVRFINDHEALGRFDLGADTVNLFGSQIASTKARAVGQNEENIPGHAMTLGDSKRVASGSVFCWMVTLIALLTIDFRV